MGYYGRTKKLGRYSRGNERGTNGCVKVTSMGQCEEVHCTKMLLSGTRNQNLLSR